jgi:hypothetical protein
MWTINKEDMGDNKEQDKGRKKSAYVNLLFDSGNFPVFWSQIFLLCLSDDFWKLHDLLSDRIATAVAAKRRHTTTNRKPNCCPPVPNEARILRSVCWDVHSIIVEHFNSVHNFNTLSSMVPWQV